MRANIGWVCLLILLAATALGVFLVFGDAFDTQVVALVQTETMSLTLAALVVLALAADIVLPIPSSTLILLAGGLWGPFGGAALSSIGLTLGCCVGLLVGKKLGEAGVATRFLATESAIPRRYARAGLWIIPLTRGVPIVAETAVLFAGAAGAPFSRALAVCAASNICLALIYSLLGSFIDDGATFLAVVAASALVAVGAWVLDCMWSRQRQEIA